MRLSSKESGNRVYHADDPRINGRQLTFGEGRLPLVRASEFYTIHMCQSTPGTRFGTYKAPCICVEIDFALVLPIRGRREVVARQMIVRGWCLVVHHCASGKLKARVVINGSVCAQEAYAKTCKSPEQVTIRSITLRCRQSRNTCSTTKRICMSTSQDVYLPKRYELCLPFAPNETGSSVLHNGVFY